MDSKKKYEELVDDGVINSLPEWFDGEVYTKGGEVTNPFSGQKYHLNADELSMYDLIMGLTYVGDIKGWNNELVTLHHKACMWFRTKNSEAYMVLLD
tara:strand:- start:1 stop:291 length:291 start_codon:yes stop_codon:yes gene_type:complete